MAFVIVGYTHGREDDELYETYDDIIVTYLGPIRECRIRDLSEIYGEELAKKILKAYENDEMREITGIEKLKILKSVDEYHYRLIGIETYYSESEDILVVYELKVRI